MPTATVVVVRAWACGGGLRLLGEFSFFDCLFTPGVLFGLDLPDIECVQPVDLCANSPGFPPVRRDPEPSRRRERGAAAERAALAAAALAAASLAAAVLAAPIAGATLAVCDSHTAMRRLLMLVFVRARRHTHRYARWYVAAVAGSIVYRAYVLCLITDPHTPPLAGAIRGQPVGLAHSVLRRGELRGEPLEAVAASGGNESAQVVIVGAGVSGLVAAWELRKRGVTDVLVLEMDDAPGGNARSGYDGPGGIAYPWGAHYVPLPSRGATRMLLEELGLMRSAAADGAGGVAGVAGVGADALCPEPSERLFVRGVGWRDAPDGLLPEAAMSEADWVQLRTFRSLIGQQARRQTADGRPPFVLPLAECSFDQEARALDGESMHTLLLTPTPTPHPYPYSVP